MPEKTKSTFELINELIIALSHLLWPLLVIVIVLLFRGEISEILKRLRKGKILGQELELDEKIEEFDKVTTKASVNIVSEDRRDDPVNDDIVDQILSKSAEDPKIGIMLLSREIEKELNKLTASMGLLREDKVKSIRNAFEVLSQNGYISKEVVKSVTMFTDLRNKVIHGKEIEDKGQLIRMVDIGATLLNTLKAIPHQRHTIYRINIDLFSDQNCNNKRSDVQGIILESVSSVTKGKRYAIYPTTNRNYEIGVEVSWEWKLDRSWDASWYKDPDTGQVKEAWSSSAEFAGRPIKEK